MGSVGADLLAGGPWLHRQRLSEPGSLTESIYTENHLVPQKMLDDQRTLYWGGLPLRESLLI